MSNHLALRSDAGVENRHWETWVKERPGEGDTNRLATNHYEPSYEPLRHAPQFETKGIVSLVSIYCCRNNTHSLAETKSIQKKKKKKKNVLLLNLRQ